jgi:excisionase family DNA binding protein
MELAMTDEILTAQELCKYLKIPRSSLYKLAREKNIPGFRVGRHWRFKKSKFEAWLEKQESAE